MIDRSLIVILFLVMSSLNEGRISVRSTTYSLVARIERVRGADE